MYRYVHAYFYFFYKRKTLARVHLPEFLNFLDLTVGKSTKEKSTLEWERTHL